jgi:hypothetical protein
LPSGKAKPITVSMNNCNQVHGSSLGFLEDLVVAKKSRMTNKDVANFWNIYYYLCNLMLLHQFLFAIFPRSHCILGFSFNLGDPSFFFSFFNGAWLFSLVEKLGENV